MDINISLLFFSCYTKDQIRSETYHPDSTGVILLVRSIADTMRMMACASCVLSGILTA